MAAVETIATVSIDGTISMPAPQGVRPGKHRVRFEIVDDEAAEERPATPPYKGRRVISISDRKQMDPPLPPETEWAKEAGIDDSI